MRAPAGVDRDVVMLTDGMPDPERRQSTQDSARKASAGGVTLSTLGVGQQDVDLEFLTSLTPHALVIEAVNGIAGAMATLLTQAAEARSGGLREVEFE
jgi:hypothetical protein